MIRRLIAAVMFIGALTVPTAAQDEITLFSGQGEATAYIAVEEDSTIYLWSGKPVAYLDDDPAGGFHVYGFNGKHLGWLANGILWDHQGHVACATKDRMRTTNFEPFKAFKAFKPFKAFKEFAPFHPLPVESWSDTPCSLLLARGGG